jgi:hypothetical protein
MAHFRKHHQANSRRGKCALRCRGCSSCRRNAAVPNHIAVKQDHDVALVPGNAIKIR